MKAETLGFLMRNYCSTYLVFQFFFQNILLLLRFMSLTKCLTYCFKFQAINNQVAVSSAPTLQASHIPSVASVQQIVLLNPSQLTALQPQFMLQAPNAGLVRIQI